MSERGTGTHLAGGTTSGRPILVLATASVVLAGFLVAGAGAAAEQPMAIATGRTVMPHRNLALRSTTNGRIAFSRSVGGRGVIVSARPDGRDQRIVATPEGASPGFGNADLAQWSPNGRTLVFEDDAATTAPPPGEGFHKDIYSVSARRGSPKRLTQAGVNENPSWSADGRTIVFERADCDCAPTTPYVGHIAVMRADGTGAHDLTTSPWACCDEDAELSPDGRLIVFERTQNSDSRSALFIMNADGSALRRLTPWTSQAGQPDWSPDGRWILYNDGSGSVESSRHLLLVRPDGTHRRRVPNGAGGYEATWSPDGRNILFVRAGDLWVMGRDGAGAHQITRTAAREANPDWGIAPLAG